MKIELLAPAGDELSAKAAFSSGADAIYLGLRRFSARSGAENFDEEACLNAFRYAHILGGKVYVCLNTLVKDSETEEFFDTAHRAFELGADGILIQDLFLGKALKRAYPEMTLHLSTQGGCCNVYGADLARDYGFSRVVLARETPISEIEKISKIIETEVFVQGALCSAFSGQCYFSSFAGNNSGNRGRCKQPCRRRYSIDRAPFEEFSYALSPADLCAGERVKDFIEAGVSSLKIEGRMRRPEYVAAAAGYYRALIDGKRADTAFSDLKRAYNRGDYTRGLAFGQDKFLSRKVQGHIGERVGTIESKNFCRSDYPARKGDGFKILRGGKEVCGAIFRASAKGGFLLSSAEKLLKNDEVRLTTESGLKERLIREKKRPISLKIVIKAGEPLIAECGEFRFRGAAAEPAQNAPLTAEEVKECFSKTDLPFLVRFSEVQTENAFFRKSALNAERRRFFEEAAEFFSPRRKIEKRAVLPEGEIVRGSTPKTAILSPKSESADKADILIFKPQSYRKILPPRGEKVFLYLPPFLTGEEADSLLPMLSSFEGIYCDGYYGLAFAEKAGKKFFAGTGFNLTNKFSVSAVQKKAEYFALSKELDQTEQNSLSGRGAFVLEGDVKIMDLCYCLFEKTCALCDRREEYLLTDEEGRKFPLRRYEAKECRFELYNCAPLIWAKTGAGRLIDKTVSLDAPPTKGHTERSML